MKKGYIMLPTAFPLQAEEPWKVVENLCEIISRLIKTLDDEYVIKDCVAIHRTAVIGTLMRKHGFFMRNDSWI
jgi:hypothetical protein